ALFAGALAGIPSARIAAASGITLSWLVGLMILNICCRRRAIRVVGLLAAVTLSAGIPMIFYLNREFSEQSRPISEFATLSPAVGALVAAHDGASVGMWMSPGVISAVALLALLITRRGKCAVDRLSTSPDSQITTSGG